MTATTDFLAVDLGASNGRVLAARWDGARFALDEIHRFANGPVEVTGRLHWDVLRLWTEIQSGLRRYASEHRNHPNPPAGIGVDTWGVDFALLDRDGRLLGNPVHYRDDRNNGMPELAFQTVPASEIFAHTGIQFMQINTLFQLYAMRHHADPQLELAATLLMMPDLFHYWLTGRKAVEYTIASTSQMFSAMDRRWATGLLARLHLPTHILPPIVAPGEVLGTLQPAVVAAASLSTDHNGSGIPVIEPGSHDTASAVAAIPGLDARSVYISSGTWSLMGVEIPEPIINERTRNLNFTNEGGVGNTIRLLKNIGGLWLLQECQRHWALEGQDYSWAHLLDQAGSAPPFRSLVDPDAADFLNPPHMLTALRDYCVRTGQPAPETVGQTVRCCLESLALRYRWVFAALEELTGTDFDTIRIVGGGSQNRLLCQFAADACRRPVVAGPVEATALGNVMLQAIATGHLSSISDGRAAIAASIPQSEYAPGSGDGWDEAYERFLSLL